MITQKELEIAKFNAIFGDWIEKELYRRLKTSYETEKKIRVLEHNTK